MKKALFLGSFSQVPKFPILLLQITRFWSRCPRNSLPVLSSTLLAQPLWVLRMVMPHWGWRSHGGANTGSTKPRMPGRRARPINVMCKHVLSKTATGNTPVGEISVIPYKGFFATPSIWRCVFYFSSELACCCSRYMLRKPTRPQPGVDEVTAEPIQDQRNPECQEEELDLLM